MERNQIIKELSFKAIRSGGAGGQHVNKVSSKVELTFDVVNSEGLSDQERERVLLKLESRLTQDGVLKLQCDESRSQHKNKGLVTSRFFEMLKKSLEVPKKRKRTRPSKSAIEKRLKTKKIKAWKKVGRKRPPLE
ncbi:alternative ribosome rescue aminoacyl-tRNA hydrolase ArfB [Flagellimonas meishanensis]|uniref:alternative ribosome rescue aminoacyl-tRNA hydrolase ArfB n=1 Tax=Flagellimonas meishanensis TaxID=2873264 RepID=UPI001CA601DB|nr:alternative ribosome rescue aminoacyl-tRNA hydrolase ArfB [[Muricauda] meishanensis]